MLQEKALAGLEAFKRTLQAALDGERRKLISMRVDEYLPDLTKDENYQLLFFIFRRASITTNCTCSL